MSSSILKVGEEYISTNQLSYDNLVYLYKEYIQKNGRAPTTVECVSKNNLPQMRVVNRILKDNQVTYKEFMGLLGKNSHVRTEGGDFNVYLQKYKEVSERLGRAPLEKELTKNNWGLPSANWLVKNCLEPSVDSYDKFVVWTGCHSNKIKRWTKDEVVSSLKSYEQKINRGLKKSDITPENVGFSLIVINRLFGTFGNAIAECGLSKYIPDKKPLSHYKAVLKDVVCDYRRKGEMTYISWSDIESGVYGDTTYNHKTFRKVFENHGENINAFIKSCGCMLNSRGVGYRYTFDDGEMVRSNLEYKYSKFLRGLGFMFNRDYFRDVKYRNFSYEKSRIDCDYVVANGDNRIYIEIAGMMYKPKQSNWRIYNYPSERANTYRDTILKKEKILKNINVSYLILFHDDFENDEYKNKTLDVLGISICDKGELYESKGTCKCCYSGDEKERLA